MSDYRIVIVEDEGIVVMALKERLRSLGYQVAAVADSGHEAIQKVDDTRPDLVLMDIRLQGKIDGIQAAAEIRARFGTPVVYLSALTDDDTVEQAMAASTYGYIRKPYGHDELRTAIERALATHRMETELKMAEQSASANHAKASRRQRGHSAREKD
jgi:CheY-like chemotaxis protein